MDQPLDFFKHLKIISLTLFYTWTSEIPTPVDAYSLRLVFLSDGTFTHVLL